MIAQLRILTIYQLAVVIPHRWLSANCGSLSGWNFGVADMPWTVDLLDDAFGSILCNPENILKEDFMMNIFQPIAAQIPPFQEYTTYMFEKKASNPIGCWKEADKVLSYDEILAAVFYPTRVDIRQSQDSCLQLGVRWAATMRREFRDKRKNTKKYLSAIEGKASMSLVTEEERADGLGIDASNSVSESVHAASIDMLELFGTIRMDYCAAIGQSRFNNDFGRAHKNNVSGRRSTSTKKEREKLVQTQSALTISCLQMLRHL